MQPAAMSTRIVPGSGGLGGIKSAARRMTGQQALHAIVRGARPTCVQSSRRIGAARNLGWIDRALKILREPPPYA